MVIQLVTDSSSVGAAPLERRARNRKVKKPWLDSRCGSSSHLRKKLNAILEPQAVYRSWWPNLTKDYKQGRSVLEWYDRHRT